MKRLLCVFKTGSVCVELKSSEGTVIFDTITIENDVEFNMYKRSELDDLLTKQ